MFTLYKMLHLNFNQKENMQLSFKEKKYIWKGEEEQCTLIELNWILKNTLLLDEEYIIAGLSFLSFVLFFSHLWSFSFSLSFSHTVSSLPAHREDASLARRTWTFPGLLPKYRQNLVYIFIECWVYCSISLLVPPNKESYKHKKALVSSCKCVCSMHKRLIEWLCHIHRPELYKNDPDFSRYSFPFTSSPRSCVLASEWSSYSPDSLGQYSITFFLFTAQWPT